jgi:DNA-directed RNA polymerase subunit RPC12/RpoP
MNRFRYERDVDVLACSKCGSRVFRYKNDDGSRFGLRPITSAGPIHVVTPAEAAQPQLQTDVTCAECGAPYAPSSVWDPAS